jgi:ABC-2 type transport system ATP-binding protein
MTSGDGLALATRGLQKSYGSRNALAGLDLSVPSGVVYGFLGPNGAGKTTTMRLLTGLIHADAGTIELLGRPFGRDDRHRLFDVGALKQRLGIAAALLSDPRLLLLDEPSNGLDPAGIVAMRTTLRQLAATGKTVFVSSHVLGEVQQLADVIGIIAAGQLVREGPIAELLHGEGVVRVRVGLDQVDPAIIVLQPLVPAEQISAIADEPGWLSVRIAPDRAADVNRTLASAGIYATGLETGSDLESLFLELTRADSAADHEGTFFGLAGAGTKNDGDAR